MSQHWDPLRDLVVLQDRMNRLFEDATQRRARGASETQDDLDRSDWAPAADVYEREDTYLIALDLPGVDRSALEINLDKDRLSIRGNRSIENGRQTQRRAERPRGKFSRSFALPALVDQERIEAEYKDGVLSVRLPKRKEQQAQRVEIKVS
jgi:HSP20 family protein